MTKLDKRMIKIEQSQHRLESRLKKCKEMELEEVAKGNCKVTLIEPLAIRLYAMIGTK